GTYWPDQCVSERSICSGAGESVCLTPFCQRTCTNVSAGAAAVSSSQAATRVPSVLYAPHGNHCERPPAASTSVRGPQVMPPLTESERQTLRSLPGPALHGAYAGGAA